MHRPFRHATLGLLTAATALSGSPLLALEGPRDKPAAPAARVGSGYQELDWDALLSEAERKDVATLAPPPAHDYLGENGPAAQQSQTYGLNPKLDGKRVKLPGFVVPLDVGKDGLVSEFFLVPYYGACIHVPPPPPNQIVYVRMAKGVALESIYDAYWITGRMSLQKKTTRLGASAYTLAGDKIETYAY